MWWRVELVKDFRAADFLSSKVLALKALIFSLITPSNLLSNFHPLFTNNHHLAMWQSLNILLRHLILHGAAAGRFTMAEALAVARLVSEIVQFVEFGTKVVSRLHEFLSSVNDMPKTFQDVNNRLPILIDSLKRTQAQADAHDI